MAISFDRWRDGAVIAGLLVGCLPRAAAGQGVLTQQEALRLAFGPGALIERRTAYLDQSQIDSVMAIAGPGVSVVNPVVTYYVGVRDDRPIAAAYFDVHTVRTQREVLMIVVTPPATIERIEVLRFGEPPEYRPSASWLEQFAGRPLSDDLALSGALATMTGATLTSRAVTGAARRTLALHAVVAPFGPTPAAGR